MKNFLIYSGVSTAVLAFVAACGGGGDVTVGIVATNTNTPVPGATNTNTPTPTATATNTPPATATATAQNPVTVEAGDLRTFLYRRRTLTP